MAPGPRGRLPPQGYVPPNIVIDSLKFRDPDTLKYLTLGITPNTILDDRNLIFPYPSVDFDTVMTESSVATPTFKTWRIGAGYNNSLLGLTSLGDKRLLYASAQDTLAGLAPNTAASTKFLTQVGDGSAASAPAWSSMVSSEIALNTPVAGGNDTVIGTTNRFYTFFTLPTAYKFYQITGFEAKNGTVAAGTFIMHLWAVGANPPVAAGETLLAWCAATAMAGTSAVQRVNVLSSQMIPGGKLVGAALSTNDATARYGTTTVGSANRLKALALNSGPPNGDTTAWAAGTEEPYIKIYGVGYIPA